MSGDRQQRGRWRKGLSRWSGWPRAAAAEPGSQPQLPAPRPGTSAAEGTRPTAVSRAAGPLVVAVGLTIAARDAVGG